MDVWRITIAAVRRWYILIPLLALTGWGAWTAGNGIHPEYEVHATAMLLPGRAVSEVPNPYGGIDEANQAVGIVLNSMEAQAQIAAQGLSAEYTVTPESRSNILRFVVRADDPGTAIASGTALLDLARTELSTRQGDAGVPSSGQIGIDVLAPPSVLDVVYEGKLRVQAIIGILGASIALVVAVLFDDIVGLVKRRRRRRKAASSTREEQTGEIGVDDRLGRPAKSESHENDLNDENRTSSESNEDPLDADRRSGARVPSTLGE